VNLICVLLVCSCSCFVLFQFSDFKNLLNLKPRLKEKLMALIAEHRQQEEGSLDLVNIELDELKEFLMKSYDVFVDLTIDSFIRPTAGGFFFKKNSFL